MKRLTIALTLLTVCTIALARIAAQDKQPSGPRPGKPIVIPTRYDEHRFYATPITKDNVKLNLYSDTAGRLYLYEDTVERLQLTTITLPEEGDNGQPLRTVAWPAFDPNAAIPSPLGTSDDHLYVRHRQQNEFSKMRAQRDGMLGQQWFAGRVWTFDYPNQRLLWRAPGDLPRHDQKQEVKLGIKTDGSGRLIGYTRIPVEIDGETIDFVLDTGAANVLSDDVLKAIGDGRPADRAASFLTRTVFEKWHKRHPDWRTLENIKTLTGTAMIEVPEINLGGFKVGPVWFSVQTDYGFHNVMDRMTDKPTEGALGGSALHYLRMTVDWPKGIAIFERP